MARKEKFIALILILFLISMVSLVCCSRGAKQETSQPATEVPITKAVPVEEKSEKAPIEVKESWKEAPVAEATAEIMSAEELNMMKVLKTVYFDFDKFELRDDTIASLKENAEWLKNNPSFSIMLEGHCDERGTIEYNLELGAKRANAVMNYLISLGLKPEQFKTISYGEEKPADPGHDESAWAKNRRVEFVIEK